MDQVVHAKWWRVPVGDVPRDADYESQVQWLYDWWQRIDTWITQNRPSGTQAPALPPRRAGHGRRDPEDFQSHELSSLQDHGGRGDHPG
jgi:hypothetical protein